MRVRSVALVLSMSALLAAAVVRCTLPPLPPGPEANPTRIGFLRGAILSVPASGAIDRAGLIASLKEAKLTTVILQAVAREGTAFVSGQVSLAVELQRELDADVFIATYQAAAPIATALGAAGASKRIGCFVSEQPELVDTLGDQDRTALTARLHDASAACVQDGRRVALSLRLPVSGDANRAGVLLREVLRDTGIGVVMLEDGAGTADAAPSRAALYYSGLRNALADRLLTDATPPSVEVWANVEAYDCVTPSCTQTHPTTAKRFIKQLCGARARVEGIVTVEYLHDLAERPLVDASTDGDPEASVSPDLQSLFDDTDAAAQLRKGYLEWRDAGGSCAP